MSGANDNEIKFSSLFDLFEHTLISNPVASSTPSTQFVAAQSDPFGGSGGDGGGDSGGDGGSGGP